MPPHLSTPPSVGPIYLDANPLADKHITGIGRYTARLALAMSRHVPIRFFSNGTELILPTRLDWSMEQDLAVWGRKVWKSPRKPLGTPPAGSVGIYACLRPIERHFDHEISILYDFTPQVVPWTHSEKTRSLFYGFYARSLPSSDQALAISEATKADAAWLTDFDQDRIEVEYPGPSLCVGHQCAGQSLPRRPEVGLVVSTLEPRKNAFFLLDWFRNSSVLPENAELWWVGPLGWLTSRKQLQPYRELLGSRRIRFLGVISDSKLCRLYRSVGWSIYPSLYEGFGFPVLDSLRHGTPILTSYNSSLREFQWPGVYFFDPCEPSSVDHAFAQFQAGGNVSIPTSALDARYSWERVALKVLEMARLGTSHKSPSERMATA